ncbi:hypothetical protein M9Y10_014330 [Tritrichomonas musculus]|uniref:Uncharacterized protein n=1 Tax=Tritrichomonas musculus TaxID=1915356 RepID=A0ABR2KZ83_9EUKA
MKKSSCDFDAFSMAEQLILGAPISNVPRNEIQNVLGALCSLRNETYSVNTSKERINQINSLIYELQQYIAIPNKSKIRASKSNSMRRTRTKQNPSSMSQEEINYLNTMIDNSLEGGDICPENETQRRTLISMLKTRREAEIEASDYYKVEMIDDTIKSLRSIGNTNNDFLHYRLSVLTRRLEMVQQKRDELNHTRKDSINSLKAEQNEQYQLLLKAQKEEMIDFCQTLPQFDDPRNIRFSERYLTMRFNEKNYARGGDYDGATKLHQDANVLEEKERHDAVNRIIQSCNLKRSSEEKRQKMKRQCFTERWNQKIDSQNADFDRIFSVLNLQEEALQSEIISIKKKLGMKTSNIATSKTRSARY